LDDADLDEIKVTDSPEEAITWIRKSVSERFGPASTLRRRPWWFLRERSLERDPGVNP
jgi:hypothetical protein